MPNLDGTGPASAGSINGFQRGRWNGRGRGLGETAGRGRYRMRCQRFASMTGFGGRWLGCCIEELEQHIARMQQRLSLLKARFARQVGSAQI